MNKPISLEVFNVILSLCDDEIIDTKFLRGYLARSLDKGTIDNLSYVEFLNQINEYDKKFNKINYNKQRKKSTRSACKSKKGMI